MNPAAPTSMTAVPYTTDYNLIFRSTVPYIVDLFPEAVEIKYVNNRTVWASNLANSGHWPLRTMVVQIPGSPAFRSSEALFQWVKASFFDDRLHLPRYGDDAYPEAEGRGILRSTFTSDLTGAQAKSRAGQLAFSSAIGRALKNKQKATRLYKKILPEWFEVSYQVMEEVIRAKFRNQNRWLVNLLLSTGERPLYEGRRRAGSVWEVASESSFASLSCRRKWGFLGTILMRRRDELRRDELRRIPPNGSPKSNVGEATRER